MKEKRYNKFNRGRQYKRTQEVTRRVRPLLPISVTRLNIIGRAEAFFMYGRAN